MIFANARDVIIKVYYTFSAGNVTAIMMSHACKGDYIVPPHFFVRYFFIYIALEKVLNNGSSYKMS